MISFLRRSVPSAVIEREGTADRPARRSRLAIRAEQVRRLYGSPVILLVNMINAPIAASLLWHIYPAWILLGWVSLVFVAVAARVLLWRRFQHKQPDVEDTERWGRAFALGAAVTGCLWGLLGIRRADDGQSRLLRVRRVRARRNDGRFIDAGRAVCASILRVRSSSCAAYGRGPLRARRLHVGRDGPAADAFAAVLMLMDGRTTDGSSKTSGYGSSSVSKPSAIS